MPLFSARSRSLQQMPLFSILYTDGASLLFVSRSLHAVRQPQYNEYKIYNEYKSKIMEALESNVGRVAITTDMWTSDHQMKGYMAVTTHYIDDGWQLQNRIIRFCYVPAPHTKEVITDALMDCFLKWNIDRKLSTLTVDNCSVNDGVIHLLKDRLSPTTMILE
ncbi:zinc finger BED domain-containing protein RICESLEEPER 1-like [Canna indica]|uniref:Zinc finger BED domain-containing protein RICESLEEPER 1-like n=1 Tax=Canna indica TaxID=4628 RepID=A0AAQ3KML0_9LILI|nr:zinc finger BED domain-containing protein RICESLEEPER 1-like [Canna indica]